MSVKQVIVIRRDLKMRRGKEIAQGAHASLAFLSHRIREADELPKRYFPDNIWGALDNGMCPLDIIREWILGSFAKITCKVNSEEELLEIYRKAKDKRLEVHLITDSGKTEFNGVPTNTCLAIGPDEAKRIDEITGHLELY